MNNKFEQEFKPRKWLLILLIIVALAIVVVLANKIVTEEKGKDHNIFNIFDLSEKEDPSHFNFMYESDSGSQWGTVVCDLLDDVVTNNKTKKDHIITVVYSNTTTSDPDEIVSLKKNFEMWNNYEVSLNYDAKGFVNEIMIKEA